MIESPLPHVSHKTAPFRAPVLCGNRSSEVQLISVNRQPSTVFLSHAVVCHTERRPLFYVGTGAQPLSVNRQPSTMFKRQPGLQPAIDPELY